jgi:UDP-glucose 4-epimerase
VVAIFADRIQRGEPVTIFGDGEQTRDFLFVDDVVDAFVRGATRGGGLLLNVGTGRELSVNELARVMSEVAGSTTPPAYAPARPGELQRSALDPERAGIHLGWTAWTDLPRGVQSVLDHVRGRIAD